MKPHGYQFWTVLTLLAALSVKAAPAQTIDPEKVAAVKAAYVVNFIKYTQWPDTAFERADSPIMLTIVGQSESTPVLEEILRRTDPINGRRVVLRRLEYPTADSNGKIDPEILSQFFEILVQSHAVYVTATIRNHVRQIAEQLRGKNVLTIGDTSRFAENGGMLGLLLEQDRVVFQANTGEIQKTQLTVSAKVLKLARIVETRPD